MERKKNTSLRGQESKKVAIIGLGITSEIAASALTKEGHEVVFFHDKPKLPQEKTRRDLPRPSVGFPTFQSSSHYAMIDWFEKRGIACQTSDLSLSFSVMDGWLEWSPRYLFSQLSNIFNLAFYRLLTDLYRFPLDAHSYLQTEATKTVKDRSLFAEFLEKHNYGQYFRDYYLLLLCGSVWWCSPKHCLTLPTSFVLSFLSKHGLLTLLSTAHWLSFPQSTLSTTTSSSTITDQSQPKLPLSMRLKAPPTPKSPILGMDAMISGDLQMPNDLYFEPPLSSSSSLSESKLISSSTSVGSKLITGLRVLKEGGTEIQDEDGDKTVFDYVIFTSTPAKTLELLGEGILPKEKEFLESFEYRENEVYYHTDTTSMPKKRSSWHQWNISTSTRSNMSTTYWLNASETSSKTVPLFMTVNPHSKPQSKSILATRKILQPLPTSKALNACQSLSEIEGGDRGFFFAGVYQEWSTEDRFQNGMDVAGRLLKTIIQEPLLSSNSSPLSFRSSVPTGLTAPTVLDKSLSALTRTPFTFTRQLLRAAVLNFLKSFIKSGRLLVQEANDQLLAFGPSPLPLSTTNSPDNSPTPSPSSSLVSVASYFESSSSPSPLTTTEDDSSSITSSPSPPSLSLGELATKSDKKTLFITVPSSKHQSPPDGKTLKPIRASIILRNPQEFYFKVALGGDLGLARAYFDGDFDSEDMLKFLCLLVENRVDAQRQTGRIKYGALLTSVLGRSAAAFCQRILKRNNTPKQSQQNISDHYDLGNEFFKLWLDPTMTYSCAIYKNPTDTLEQAQRNKIDALIEKARIKSTDRVLEIGFGWGALSLMVAQRTGCHITGITLSKEQLKYSTELIERNNLSHQVKYHLVDYRVFARSHPGSFDRILSCEMLEAVGHEYLGSFYRACDTLMAPGGLLVVQVITMPDQTYEEYRTQTDFIREYIFPGSTCPAFGALTSAMLANSNFIVESVTNIGPHYALTLGEWRRNFHEQKAKVMELGFNEEFFRRWDYYFLYCQAGFYTRYLSDLQIVYSRSVNRRLAEEDLSVPPLPPFLSKC